MKFQSLLFTMLVAVLGFAQVPTITGLSSLSGNSGGTVTISGSGFSATASNNVVYFGTIKAPCISSTTTSMTVAIPTSASNGKVSYTNLASTGGPKSCISEYQFSTTFPGSAGFNVNTDFVEVTQTIVPVSTTVDATSSFGLIPSPILNHADFNVDGKIDLIIATGTGNASAYGATIYRNASTGNGDFTFSTPTSLSASSSIEAVGTADINSDGKFDVILGSPTVATNSLIVYPNTSSTATISFGTAVIIDAPNVNFIKFSDINKDGKIDILFKTTANDKIYACLNSTTNINTPTFAAPTVLITTSNIGFEVGDIDNDGDDDIMVATSGARPKYHINSGSGTFSSTATFTTASGNTFGTYGPYVGNANLVDLDGDGSIDFAGRTDVNSFSRNTTSGGTISFENVAGVTCDGCGFRSTATIDMDGDGDVDLVGGAPYTPPRMQINRNTTTGSTLSFAGYNELWLNSTGKTMTGCAVDLDNNGRPEFIQINGPSTTSSTLSIVRNKVGETLAISTHPSTTAQSYCQGVAATALTIVASGSSPTYQWEQSANGSTGWANVTSGTGATSTSYTPSTASAGTLYYRCKVTDASGTVYSNASGAHTVNANNTAGTASSNPTLCINTALTAITRTTTGATGIGTASGLPAGVTASWSANTLTVSGTPTASGTFSYTIPLTGGCGSVNATGTITVNDNRSAGTASSTPTLCSNSPLTSITHSTTGTTSIGAASGFPTGVTASFSSNVITISGVPSASGVFNYSIPLNGSCGSAANATGTITVNAQPTAPTTNNVTNCLNSTASQLTATGDAGNTIYWTSSAINQTTSNSGQTLSSGSYTIGQSFTASTAMTITGIVYNFESVTNPSAALTLTVYSGQGLSGSVLSTVNVNGSLTAGEFTFTLPTPLNLTQGQVYTFNLSTTASNPLSVRWNYNNGNVYSGGYYWRYGSAFTTDDIYFRVLTGTSTTAPTPSTSAVGSNTYLVYQTNPTSGCSSSNATLVVTTESAPSITQPSTTAIFKCYSSTAQAISVTTTATSPSYQWQQSTTSNGVFANVTTGTGGTTSSFTPAHSNIWYGGTMYYKCVVTSACGSTTSNASGAYTIGSDLVGTSFPSAFDQTYCNGATATPLTVNYASSTNWPSLTYQWKESSTQNGTFTNVTAGTGATTASYTPSTATNGTKYYQCWVGGTCGNAASAPTSGAITVSPGLNTWNGSVSNNPATAGNWTTCGTGSDVIIPAGAPNYPVYNDYTVSAGQTVTIATGAQLTVNGILTNDGTIIIQSGATLVQGATSTTAGSGNYIVKQVVSGIGNIVAPTGRFWYLGSPVASESSSVFFNSLTTTNTVVKKRSETTNSWIQITSGTPEALEVGRGYYAQIRPSANSSSSQNIPLSFSGAINNFTTASPLTLNLTRTTNSFAGFNLVSNPFPSYLDWDAVNRTNVGNTMWYRTATGNASNTMVFETYVAGAAGGIGTNLSGNVATKLIPPMQAFWVRVNSGNTTGSITLDNSMRSHFTSISGSTAGLRSTNDELKLFLRMNLLQENKKDQLIVYMNNAATNGFDILDGEKMMQAELPQFYTTAGEKKITINGLNAAKKQQSLPITLELPTTGVHTFEIEKLELEAGLVWLEDTQEGTMNALSDGITYAFYGEAGMNNDRFVLHFNILDNTTPSAPNYGEVNSSANFSGKGASVHSEAAGVVVIKLPASTEGITDIQIRDAAGKLVYTGSTNTLETSVQLAQANGIYYVTLNSATGVEVRKVFIQQ